MTVLGFWLKKACDQLGLKIEFDFAVMLSDGSRIVAFAHIQMLGAPKGMLVFRTYQEIGMSAEELIHYGYGYTVLDEPRSDEEFDLDCFKEMFTDWGWSGEAKMEPPWMHPANESISRWETE